MATADGVYHYRRNDPGQRRDVLVDLHRIEIDLPADEWLARFVAQPGVAAVPLRHEAASRAYQLEGLAHRTPADRWLIATAITLDCPLITYDGLILRFGRDHGDRYGFACGGQGRDRRRRRSGQYDRGADQTD